MIAQRPRSRLRNTYRIRRVASVYVATESVHTRTMTTYQPVTPLLPPMGVPHPDTTAPLTKLFFTAMYAGLLCLEHDELVRHCDRWLHERERRPMWPVIGADAGDRMLLAHAQPGVTHDSDRPRRIRWLCVAYHMVHRVHGMCNFVYTVMQIILLYRNWGDAQ